MPNFIYGNKELLKEWDYEKNKDIDINKITSGSNKRVWWKCEKGHEYERSVSDKLNGRTHCPYCTNRKVLKGYNDLVTTNPELLKEWDYEKNDKLGIKPDEITNGGKTKVWWKCEKGHEWDFIIRSRITGSGCPYCSGNKVLKGYNDLATTNLELLKEWDYEKNDKLGIKPFNVSHGSDKKVWWLCKKGHSYQNSVAQKIRANVICPICANQIVLKGYNDFATKHPELLKEWDYEKNDKLGIKPDEIVLGGKTKVWWKCEKGHEWISTINNRIRNNKIYNRCPICSSYLRTSIPEKIIYYYLLKVYPKTIANYKPKWLKPKEIDIFIPELNIGIEYDGYYYHKDYERDLIKDKLCLDNNIKLIRIREKNARTITSSAIIYVMKRNNTTDYTYIEDALEFLNNYLNIKMDYNILRDIDDILSMINFMEKENCIANTNPNVLKEWDYEKNEEIGLTPENTTNGSSLKVWWRCEKGHSYKATISTKINQSTNCPYCSNKTLLKGYNDLATTNPELLKEWDYEKNGKNNMFPDTIFPNAAKKVWWKCENGHSFISTPNNVVSGHGCPYCSGHKVLVGYNDLATTNPELLKEWDYEKNDKLGYLIQNYSKGNATKVWWRCENGHSYQTSINGKISNNNGCPYCSGNKVLKGYNDLVTTNPELLKEWDYEKNDKLGIKPDEITNGTHKMIWWLCLLGHSYQSSVPNRRRGQGCPYCSGNKVLKGYNDLATTNPELLIKWDYEKNDKLGINPFIISKSYSKKVWWKCEKGHSYQRYVYNERNGKGRCPLCNKKK